MVLPVQISPAAFQQMLENDAGPWLPVVAEICAAHQLPAAPLRAFRDGSNLVASVGEQVVVKIFPPFHRHQWHSEHLTLAYLENRLSVPVPELLASGQRKEGWTYVVMRQLPGQILEDVWPGLSLEEKKSLLTSIGQLMAEVHRLNGRPLPALEPDWASFLQQQQAQAFARHQRLGAPDWLLSGLHDFIRQTAAGLPLRPEKVLLTGEYTPFNILVEPQAGAWRLSGMIDFGDAMLGPREYDWLGPCVFLGEGNAHLLRSFFRGYGADCSNPNGLRQGLLLLLLLHRYSNLDLQIRIPDWQNRVDSIAGLAQLIWPDGF